MTREREAYSRIHSALTGEQGWSPLFQRQPRWVSDALMAVAVIVGDEDLVFVDSRIKEKAATAVFVTSSVAVTVRATVDLDADLSDDAEYAVEAFSLARIRRMELECSSGADAFDGAVKVRSLKAWTESGNTLEHPLNAWADRDGLMRLAELVRNNLV